MIIAFVVGVITFVVRTALLAVRAAWGIVRSIAAVAGLPVILVALVIAGLLKLALPILLIGVAVVFLLPYCSKRSA